MKNVEKADRLHLGSLIGNLNNGQYVIPDFQRDFEWEPWDVKDLLSSIFMDYYIGTLLLWKGNTDNFKTLSCEPIYAYSGKKDPRHIVLDGQQRLTAIHYAFFGPDKPFPKRSKPCIFLLDIRALLEEDYENFIQYQFVTKKYRDFLDSKEQQFHSHIFPLSEMKGGSWGTSDWIKEYRDYWQNKAERCDDENLKKTYLHFVSGAQIFRNIIEELLNQFYVSYIELDQHIDIAKVCDIFTQINSKGVRLDIFDLLNAILRPKDIFLKKMWQDAESKLEYIENKKMKIYILQVMSILEQAYCSSKYLYYLVPESTKTVRKSDGSTEQIVLIEDENEFRERWNQSVKALVNAINALKNPRDYGAVKEGFLPYPSIIPAFAAIKEFVAHTKPANIIDVNRKIRKWYWSSIFMNKYSSSVESTTAKDFMDLKKWFIDDELVPDVIEDFDNNFNNLDLINENPKGSAIYNAIFNLLVIKEARDWSTFELPEYSELDDHHIVPYSRFKEFAGKSINSILNRTPISDFTNRHIISNRLPNDYLKEMFENNDEEKVYQALSSHLISKKAVEILLRDPFTKEDYEEFLMERKRTIIFEIQNHLINEVIEIPLHLKVLDAKIEEIELSLRKSIIVNLGSDFEVYKNLVSQTIKEKIDFRVLQTLKKRPDETYDDYNSFDKRIQFFDMSEYFETIASKLNWPSFAATFKNKTELDERFRKLGTLRNAIRHSREISPLEKTDGEASILWFNTVLKK
ncbi:MAG: DUF262 domain-containing protein [Weeksellaceae bacterium]|nr:DUF262 domain-containing protein [Weeksellaceae bacterium]